MFVKHEQKRDFNQLAMVYVIQLPPQFCAFQAVSYSTDESACHGIFSQKNEAQNTELNVLFSKNISNEK